MSAKLSKAYRVVAGKVVKKPRGSYEAKFQPYMEPQARIGRRSIGNAKGWLDGTKGAKTKKKSEFK